MWPIKTPDRPRKSEVLFAVAAVYDRRKAGGHRPPLQRILQLRREIRLRVQVRNCRAHWPKDKPGALAHIRPGRFLHAAHVRRSKETVKRKARRKRADAPASACSWC